jgi:hypothetical protein
VYDKFRQEHHYPPLAASLSPHFSLFAYDRLGRGKSGNTAPYAVERYIERDVLPRHSS